LCEKGGVGWGLGRGPALAGGNNFFRTRGGKHPGKRATGGRSTR
jgi:hypothetical protein